MNLIKYVEPGNKIVITAWRKIKKNEKVKVEALDESSDEIAYVSQVEDISPEGDIVLDLPTYQGRLVKLNKDAMFRFVIHTKQGMIMFSAKAKDIFEKDKNYYARAKLTSEGEQVQRRGFYRFSCRLPMRFALLLDDEEEEKEFWAVNAMMTGEVRDLSGGGIRFLSNDNVQDNSKVRCLLDLGSESIITVGKILRKEEAGEKDWKYQYRLLFAGILEADQEKIIRYIFNEQRQQLKSIR